MFMPEKQEFETEKQSRGGWGRELWEIAKIILVSLIIVLPIRYYIAQPFIVRGASMEPNFEDRNYLVIDEISYSLRAPRRGEAVVFRFPKDQRQFFIKRIIGMPGERIEIRKGEIKVFNKSYPEGFTLQEPYLDVSDRLTWPELTATLGEDAYFVLGDNRDASSDSRTWGELEKKFIVGRAVFRAWPLVQFGLITDYSFTY